MKADQDLLIDLRREIHAHPEPAFCEVRTAATVTRFLRALSIDTRIGPSVICLDGIREYPHEAIRAFAERAVSTGANAEDVWRSAEEGTAIVAEIHGWRPGPTWGIRCDIDALAITEAEDVEHRPVAGNFRSRYDGYMHACGHDGHVAIGLGLAARLADRDFPGVVRIFFQPAEEGGRGAQAMLRSDVIDGVDRFVAIHIGLDLESGAVAGGIFGMFATTKLVVRFTGVSSHAATAPERGRNALLAAATAVLNIHALPRFSTADTRVNVGTLHAGGGANIVASRAELTCEARALDVSVNADLVDRIRRVARGAAQAVDVTVDIEESGGSTVFDCDDVMVDAVMEAARLSTAVDEVVRLHRYGASDDASLFAAAVQAAGGVATYMIIGGNRAPHHNPYFDIDERSLSVGVNVLEEMIRRFA